MATNVYDALIAQGISPSLAKSMAGTIVKEAERAAKKELKKETKGKWFPGMETKSTYIEADVEVTVVCQTCGDRTTETRVLKIKESSPRTQKVATTLCNACPEFFRKLTKDQLISLTILTRHPSLATENTPTGTLVKLAKAHKPEECIVFTLMK